VNARDRGDQAAGGTVASAEVIDRLVAIRRHAEQRAGFCRHAALALCSMDYYEETGHRV
jgi:hypothetical protein